VARSSGSRLFAVYVVVSLVPVVLLGVVVNGMVRHEIDQRALTEAVSRAQTIGDASVEPAVHGEDLRRGMTPALRARLVQATAGLHGDASVLRLRLRSVEGTIVFDAARPDAPPKPDRDQEVLDAASGELVRTLTRLDADKVDGTSKTGVRAVETYVPLHALNSTRIIGVLETYLPYAPFRQAAIASERRLTEALALGLLALWGVLAAVSWSATQRLRTSARENEWLARHDQLTGLPNRVAFAEELDACVANDRPVWVAMVDIAGFREVNEAVGLANGDRFLCRVGERLATSVGADGLVARLGGDQFGVVVAHDDGPSEGRLREAISSAVAERVEVGGIPVDAELLIGLASTEQVAGGAPVLLRAADLALHAAKEAGVGVRRYTSDLEQFDPDRLVLAGELREAITSGQLVLHYQPKIDLLSGRVRAVEALVRWEHPVRGLLQPNDFIPIAESTSLIRPLTDWVVAEAVRQLSDWERRGRTVSVSVNISARSLTDPDLAPSLLGVLATAEVAASRLEVEITETAVIADPGGARALLGRLHDAGVRISLDDFGQGATSLVSLTDLPLDEIKIDRSFILGLAESAEQRSVVEFVIALGHRLGLVVVAEGIETSDAASMLTVMGCDEGQGFMFCRPLAPDVLERWLDDRHRVLDALATRPAAAWPGARPGRGIRLG